MESSSVQFEAASRAGQASVTKTVERRPEELVRLTARIAAAALEVFIRVATLALWLAFAGCAVGGAAIYFGFVDLSARAAAPAIVSFLTEFAMKRYVAHEARDIVAPPLDGIDRLARGAWQYANSCEACHRAPGAQRIAVSQALSPAPADLSLTASRWTPEELFWITKNGLRLGAMPAWGRLYSDEEIWNLVAVTMRLPRLPADEYQQLKRVGAPRER